MAPPVALSSPGMDTTDASARRQPDVVIADVRIDPVVLERLGEIGTRLANAATELQAVQALIKASFPVGFSKLVREKMIAEAGSVEPVDEAAGLAG